MQAHSTSAPSHQVRHSLHCCTLNALHFTPGRPHT